MVPYQQESHQGPTYYGGLVQGRGSTSAPPPPQHRLNYSCNFGCWSFHGNTPLKRTIWPDAQSYVKTFHRLCSVRFYVFVPFTKISENNKRCVFLFMPFRCIPQYSTGGAGHVSGDSERFYHCVVLVSPPPTATRHQAAPSHPRWTQTWQPIQTLPSFLYIHMRIKAHRKPAVWHLLR